MLFPWILHTQTSLCLYEDRFLPLYLSSQRPFIIRFRFFNFRPKVRPLGPFSFLTRRGPKVRFQRFSGNLVIFTDFSCSSLGSWPVLIRTFPPVFQHGTAFGVWGSRDDLPGHCQRVWPKPTTSGQRFFQARRRTRRRCSPSVVHNSGSGGTCDLSPGPLVWCPVTCPSRPYCLEWDSSCPPASSRALWGLLMTLRTSASGLSHVGPTACGPCGPVSRPGLAAVSSSQDLLDVHRPYHSSKGFYSSSRSSQTAPGQLLCSSPGSLVVDWTGLQRPGLLLASVLPPPDTGAPAPALQSCVAFPPGPPIPQLTPGPAVKKTLSYSPALGSIYLLPGPVTLARSAASTSLLPPPGLPSGHQVPKTPVSAASSPVPSSASAQMTVTPSQAVTSTPQTLSDVQTLMQDWQNVFFESMRNRIMSMLSAAPPQPTTGPSIPMRNMGPYVLWQLSPSSDREASWAQPKSGSKWADGSSTSWSPSDDRFLFSKDRRSRRRDSSPSSSPDKLSPTSKRWRAMSHNPGCRSCSHNDRWHSPGPRRHRASPQSTASRCSHSSAPHRQSRTRPSLSRQSSPPDMTRRPARDMSLSPRHCWPSSPLRQSSRSIVRPLAPGGCPIIAAAAPPSPSPLLPILVGDLGHYLTAHAPGLPLGILLHVLMRRINACSSYVTCPQFLSRRMTPRMIRIHQQMIPECQQRQSENFTD